MLLEPVTTPRRIQRVASLAREIWPEAFREMLDPAQIDYMLERFQTPSAIAAEIDAGTRYDLIVHEGDDAGYCAVREGDEPHSAHLGKLYLGSPWRGSGLAGAALEVLCARAAQAGARRMTLHVNRQNGRALAFYAKAGFVRDGPRCEAIGEGWVMDDYRLVRTLP